MKFGSREICDVVFKAKATRDIGSKRFYAGEPVLYFDTLKTSTFEGAVTTVYAQGGRGNARLVGWDGERTITFTMEDALISPEGLAILAGAGLLEGEACAPVHVTERTDKVYPGTSAVWIVTDQAISAKNVENYALIVNGEEMSEPYICTIDPQKAKEMTFEGVSDAGTKELGESAGRILKIVAGTPDGYANPDLAQFGQAGGVGPVVVLDYYTDKQTMKQIDIKPEVFNGNFYIEASTLFRNTNGVDMPAEFIIPNAKVQSNFTFNMAATGDPSTFTFTMDAFPDYTKFDKTEKVFASIQMVEENGAAGEDKRKATDHTYSPA